MASLFEQAVSELMQGSPVPGAAGDGEPAAATQGTTNTVPDTEGEVNTQTEHTDQTEISAQAESPTPTQSQVISVQVTDDTGKKRTVSLDLSNPKDIDRLKAEIIPQAAGMRKFQAERDREIKARKELEAKAAELDGRLKTLDKLYAEGGEEAIIDLLGQRKGYYQDWIKAQVERQKALESATPEQRSAMQAKEEADRKAKESDSLRKEFEAYKQQIEQTREKAELANLQATVNPIFNKYRLSGTLGDEALESELDEFIWTRVMGEATKLEAAGQAPTSDWFDTEFKSRADVVRRGIGNKVEKQSSKVISEKKQQATAAVQSQVKSGFRPSADVETAAKKALNHGKIGDLLQNWSSFSRYL